jgi:hypothetical protein
MAARMAMMAMTTSNSISVKPSAGFRPFNRLKFETIFGFIVCSFKLRYPPLFFNSTGANTTNGGRTASELFWQGR